MFRLIGFAVTFAVGLWARTYHHQKVGELRGDTRMTTTRSSQVLSARQAQCQLQCPSGRSFGCRKSISPLVSGPAAATAKTYLPREAPDPSPVQSNPYLQD